VCVCCVLCVVVCVCVCVCACAVCACVVCGFARLFDCTSVRFSVRTFVCVHFHCLFICPFFMRGVGGGVKRKRFIMCVLLCTALSLDLI
jgi:hypothetical protein